MDLWPWICELPYSDEWTGSNSVFVYQLASSNPSPSKTNNNYSSQSIQLRAERTFEPITSETSIKFSICLLGFMPEEEDITIWVSDTCNLSSEKPFLPFIVQLLQEIISRSPTAHDSTSPRPHLPKLKPDPVAWILDSHSPESFSRFFNFVFLTRLFWLCACDAPPEAGSFYFNWILAPNIETFSCKHAPPILRTFFISVGTDLEQCFMRSFGYIIAKWLIFKDVGLGLKMLTPSSDYNLGFSYAMESHGLWILKGFSPMKTMKCNTRRGQENHQYPIVEAKESVIRYALAHQQLEALIQFEYSVGLKDGYIHVNTRVDNIRLHVVKLGFNREDDDDGHFLDDERYFPSRIRVWVGPEIGANYVGGFSLGQSTNNEVREIETQKIMTGSFGTKVPEVKAMARMSTRTKVKNWRWEQDAEGNAATFDGVLYDNITGVEVATLPDISSNSDSSGELVNNFRKRYKGANRVFTKKGGLVFAGEECGKGGVEWRLNKEMEGSVLKWRIGAQIWLTYLACDVNCSYHETRCVECCDEVDLPLISTNYY